MGDRKTTVSLTDRQRIGMENSRLLSTSTRFYSSLLFLLPIVDLIG